ncbi:GAP family protein [Cellulomonas hominis]
MILDAVGAFLPVALAVALSPFPLIGVTLVLAGPGGRLGGWLFAAGWMLGLGALTVVAVLVTGDADESGSAEAAILAWLRVVLGLALILLAVRKGLRRTRPGDGTELPRWMSTFESPNLRRLAGLGLVLGGVNPKNLALTVSAATSISATGLAGAGATWAGVVYVLIGSCTVLGPALAQTIAPDRAAPGLAALRRVMTANSAIITAVVLLLIGGKILGDALAAI